MNKLPKRQENITLGERGKKVSIPLKELIKNPDLLSSNGGPRCPNCDVLLQETITGKRRIGDEDYCSDCYYEKLGELVEQHPITTGRVRRG